MQTVTWSCVVSRSACAAAGSRWPGTAVVAAVSSVTSLLRAGFRSPPTASNLPPAGHGEKRGAPRRSAELRGAQAGPRYRLGLLGLPEDLVDLLDLGQQFLGLGHVHAALGARGARQLGGLVEQLVQLLVLFRDGLDGFCLDPGLRRVIDSARQVAVGVGDGLRLEQAGEQPHRFPFSGWLTCRPDTTPAACADTWRMRALADHQGQGGRTVHGARPASRRLAAGP